MVNVMDGVAGNSSGVNHAAQAARTSAVKPRRDQALQSLRSVHRVSPLSLCINEIENADSYKNGFLGLAAQFCAHAVSGKEPAAPK